MHHSLKWKFINQNSPRRATGWWEGLAGWKNAHFFTVIFTHGTKKAELELRVLYITGKHTCVILKRYFLKDRAVQQCNQHLY